MDYGLRGLPKGEEKSRLGTPLTTMSWQLAFDSGTKWQDELDFLLIQN